MVAASKVSAKKARANRRNAKKSTGPKTAEGKKIASQNATSHGIYCRHVVLDGEDQQRFDLLRNAYLHSLRPQDELELSFVDRVVQDQWKLNRLQAAEQRLYDFRRREHQSLLERRRAGELGAPPLMEKRWERVDNVLDPMAEPDFTAFCSALGSTSVTMLSLLGDERANSNGTKSTAGTCISTSAAPCASCACFVSRSKKGKSRCRPRPSATKTSPPKANASPSTCNNSTKNKPSWTNSSAHATN